MIRWWIKNYEKNNKNREKGFSLTKRSSNSNGLFPSQYELFYFLCFFQNIVNNGAAHHHFKQQQQHATQQKREGYSWNSTINSSFMHPMVIPSMNGIAVTVNP